MFEELAAVVENLRIPLDKLTAFFHSPSVEVKHAFIVISVLKYSWFIDVLIAGRPPSLRRFAGSDSSMTPEAFEHYIEGHLVQLLECGCVVVQHSQYLDDLLLLRSEVWISPFAVLKPGEDTLPSEIQLVHSMRYALPDGDNSWSEPEPIDGACQFLSAELELCSQLIGLDQSVPDVPPYGCVAV